jgi:hypothetical protein
VTDANDIRLIPEQQQRLAKVADQNGQSWQAAFDDALTQLERKSRTDEEHDLDTEFLELCVEEIRGRKPVSLARMREILSKVSGSMAQDIIADREDRL